MNIEAMRCRITFQRAQVQVDKYKNHKNTWTDYFTCWATGAHTSGSEQTNEAGQQVIPQATVDFTCRCCSELKAVTKDGFRIRFGNDLYNIVDINPNAWKNNSLKFRCQLVKR